MRSLIIPVAGKSSRFSETRPKWMLNNPNGNLMIIDAISGIDIDFYDNIYITMLKSHEEKYSISKSLKNIFIEKFKKEVIITLLDEQTNSQPETVYKTIIINNISGFISIKDSDNYFTITPKDENSISVFDLHNIKKINPSNKSYIILDSNNNVINIAEKKIISNLFCSGYYSFKDAFDFIKYFELLKNNDSLYVSHIIIKMIMDNHKFISIESPNYIDWGTKEDWLEYKSEYKVIFCDIDGVLVYNSSEYFNPNWGTTDGIVENINHLKKLYESKKCQLILTTSRTEKYKKITEKQLDKYGLKYDQIIFGLLHGKRYIINDFSNTNPYPSCISININRDSNNLKELL